MPTATPGDVPARLDDPVDAVTTPTAVVDLDVMERNVEAYAAVADEHDVSLRSHVKTHKIPDIAHYQCERTGGGVVCQTLGEAEVMVTSGVDDVYLSYMVVGDRNLDRLARLARKADRFATTVDCERHVRDLQSAAASHDVTVEAVVELDVGLERVGVTDTDTAVGLARLVDAKSNVEFAGVMAYEGHVYGDDDVRTADEYESACLSAMDEAAATIDRIEAAGIEVRELKAGGTATSRYTCRHPAVTEINPGMYVFNDANLARRTPDVALEDCALAVHATVISAPTDDRIVVDAGSKSIGLESAGDPVARGYDGVDYYAASEEHGWVDVSDCEESFEVGDRLSFVVPHVCTTVNLHDALVGVRDGRVAELWEVAARGKVR